MAGFLGEVVRGIYENEFGVHGTVDKTVTASGIESSPPTPN